jgi:hypothetical protein
MAGKTPQLKNKPKRPIIKDTIGWLISIHNNDGSSKEDRNSNYSTKNWVDFVKLKQCLVFFRESLIKLLNFM